MLEPAATPAARTGPPANAYMMEYNLGPHDAVHLASALSAGVVDLASFDRGFRKVERLYLWNDRIFRAEEPE